MGAVGAKGPLQRAAEAARVGLCRRWSNVPTFILTLSESQLGPGGGETRRIVLDWPHEFIAQ